MDGKKTRSKDDVGDSGLGLVLDQRDSARMIRDMATAQLMEFCDAVDALVRAGIDTTTSDFAGALTILIKRRKATVTWLNDIVENGLL